MFFGKIIKIVLFGLFQVLNEGWCVEMMNKKFRKTLQTAVLLSCTILFPWQAMAEEAEDDYKYYTHSFICDEETFLKANIVLPGQVTDDGDTREFEAYELKSFEEQALVYLKDVAGKPKDFVPEIGLIPLAIYDFNASAYSESDISTGNTKYGNYFIGSGVNDAVVNELVAIITVDDAVEGYKWYAEEYPILPLNGMDSDYPGTIVHEMVHAMGVAVDNLDDNGYAFDVSENLEFNNGLYDALGRNLGVLSKGEDYLSVESITAEKYEDLKDNIELHRDDVFYVINYEDVGTNGGVYFSGNNVKDVIGEGTLIAWPDGLGVAPVPGIPINCYEDDYLELSHLELQNSLMSHQMYRNWCTLMEAELAVLQDLGFAVERKKFFGQSIYASGKEDINISNLANGNGAPWISDTDRAIGLHIYGSNNKVTLGSGADITANGSYSMGVRVDGVGNDLTIISNIKVGYNDAERHNYGISVNYGKGHNVTINSSASVIAKGEGSVGAIFDFGSNELSDSVEYRGSYIRGQYSDELDSFETDEEEIFGNVLTDTDTDGPLAGALVETFNVNGTLQGEKAIYISPNALVKEINIAGNEAKNSVDVKGDIISEWNPEGVEYFYTRDYGGENPYEGLKPKLPNDNLDNYRTKLNFNGDRTFSDNIIGPYGLIMNVKSGTLTTANGSSENSSYTNVHTVNVGDDTLGNAGATYKVNNILMAEYGYGVINVIGNGKLEVAGDEGAILIAFNDEDGDGVATSGIINNFGTVDFSKGSLALMPEGDYFDENTKVQVLVYSSDNDDKVDNGERFGGIWFVDMNGEKAETAESNSNSRALSANDAYKITKTLIMSAEQVLDEDSNTISVTTERSFDDVVLGNNEAAVGKAIENVDGDINSLANERGEDWKDMLSAIDFMKTDGEINNALGQLSPVSYGYGAMATMDLHRMLSDFAVGGSLAPTTNAKEKGKWHNIVIPYASETDHIKNGSGYKNNHTGMIGAMERTLGDVTVGWHAALNHQSTTGAEAGRLKGEGIYLGAQVKYEPESWKGWSAFGIARVGVEDLEMQRKFNFNGYAGKVNSDFTAVSGNLRVGGTYEKEAKAITFGPFAAIDYAFAHHPSIDEEGISAGRLSLDGGTYDSLRTQLGYRMQTAPKLLEDRTYWQANAAIAWNHELLDDAGRISASFRDFGESSFGCDVDNYGRDSLSLMAGMTFKNPTKLDVTFNLGTDIYRHGGNTLYVKCALEWKF